MPLVGDLHCLVQTASSADLWMGWENVEATFDCKKNISHFQ